MRAARPLILAVLAAYVVTYLAAAFILLDLDVTRWTQDTRTAVVVIGAFIAAFVFLPIVVRREWG
ncbi:hypothetical protein GCM10023232_26860 [Sphingosinicella ginsenosidimutans]|uniref:DUF2842 domain-containing protein n=1 Tax=Allosphingosinicella ginsenosidimutans TaxID=1176539 RepID=A0A5C6TTG7_9SPHN|nr:hypothetical protein [Sphingosinicella ginsenosidimutans]TXC63703.1 hypothetical protein FRZ32_08550 [Sphingosinicella ginsenosidimutans]